MSRESRTVLRVESHSFSMRRACLSQASKGDGRSGSEAVEEGEQVDVVYSFGADRFREGSLQLLVRDVARSG